MVGVPGKYRGCETCRSRRVKCGNERPVCKRCADSNRDCTYERETVFIVASIEDGGRCSSHPPRKTAKKTKAASKSPTEERLELIAEEPLASAWNDLISVSNFGKQYTLQIAAIHTHLQSVVRSPRDDESDDGGNKTAPLSFTPYEIPDVQPSPSDDDFLIRSRSMVHLPPSDSKRTEETSPRAQVDGIFLFLYEHNNSISSGTIPPWRDINAIRQQGPESFRLFPNHHYFVRVYRHNAIGAALLNRKQSFLSEQPWITAPWEIHQKSTFDRLLDVVVLLPGILQRADRIVTQEQTLARRLMAQDLLNNCINLELQFDQWLAATSSSHGGNGDPSRPSDLFWIETTDSQMIPFADTFAFRDGLTAVSLIHYWTAQLLFCPCVESLYWTFFQPVVDGPFPQSVPALPPTLEDINMMRYGRKAIRELASNICRSLDFALARIVQPDLLVVPLFVVWQFYQHLGLDHGGGEDEVFGDGRLELMWCDAFRQRLVAKGRDMQDVVQGKQWRDVASF